MVGTSKAARARAGRLGNCNFQDIKTHDFKEEERLLNQIRVLIKSTWQRSRLDSDYIPVEYWGSQSH